MTPLSQIELDAAPKATLAGKEYAVPFLVPRQQRIIVPKLLQLMNSMSVEGKMEIDVTRFTTEQYDMLCDIVWVGISRGAPDLTRDAFMDLETGLLELMAAMDVVAQQSKTMKRANPGDPAPVPSLGEATATDMTGTLSLPA